MWKAIFEEFEVDADMEEILNAQLSLQLKFLKKSELFGVEGLPSLLQELRRNDIPVCVATSFPAIFIKEVLKKIKLERYVTAWLSLENVDKNKPEPEVFLKAAEILGVDASGCIVISDTKNGVLAAKRAGMKCLGLINRNLDDPNAAERDVSKAAAVGDSIEAIRKLLPLHR
jgi:HAD superfamily hydrolase (TIGR01509 family)